MSLRATVGFRLGLGFGVQGLRLGVDVAIGIIPR